jgi:hypothetical protein
LDFQPLRSLPLKIDVHPSAALAAAVHKTVANTESNLNFMTT